MNKMLMLLVMSFSLVTTSVVAKEEKKENFYDWEPYSVLDGDTVKFKVKWLLPELGDVISIRVYGIDTPEKGHRAQCDKERQLGEKATLRAKKLLETSKQIKVTVKDWDKYGGRFLGDIYVDGKSWREIMISEGLAREYFGGTKQSWCTE